MKTIFLAVFLTSQIGWAGECLTTNVVDILPYIETFDQALELGLPRPLTTNHVSKFHVFSGAGLVVASVTIQDRWAFGFNATGYVSSFIDRKHSMTVLWKAEDLVPFLQPSKLTKTEATALAEKYLRRLGYCPDPSLPPIVKGWKWEAKGTSQGDPLPFFTVKFPWKEEPDIDRFTVEIDGLRERVNYFSTMSNEP